MHSEKTSGIDRRDFLKAGVTGVALGVLPGCVEKKTTFRVPKKTGAKEGFQGAAPKLSVPEHIPPGQGTLLRMHAELAVAAKKPIEELQWKMVINTNQCIGCYACEVACISENVSPPGVTLRKVFATEYGTFPEVTRTFMPSNCMQCNNPPCVKAAPDGGMERRPDGIVTINPKKFKDKEEVDAVIGACPYKNAIFYDDGSYFTRGTGGVEGTTDSPQPYEEAVNYQYGSINKRKDLVGKPRKCDFCLHRLRNGMLPACVTTCVGGAMYFGDGNDPGSLVSELMRVNEVGRINDSLGTDPNVVYIAVVVPDVMPGLGSCTPCHPTMSLK